jgi:hypothetical protein
MARRTAVALVLGLVAMAGVTACGTRSSTGKPSEGDRVPITSRAIAAVMLDHISGDTSRREATYVDETSPRDYVGADFRYHGDGESDGDLVRVTLQHARSLPACERERCTELRGGAQLRWELRVPEEDPGIVALSLEREGTLVTALVSGPDINRDPRTMELQPSVNALTDLVSDPRLRLRTSPQAVADGRQVTDWSGGERQPGELDEVPNDDQTVITGFIFGWEDGWRYVGPSPLKRLLGRGAIGGRVTVSKELQPVGPGTVDALAAPQPPVWLTRCLAGYTCWSRGAMHFVWKPANGSDPGDAFLVHVARSGETAVLHTKGRYRLSQRRQPAMAASGYFLWGSDFYDPESPLRVGLTTTRDRYEQAEKTIHG